MSRVLKSKDEKKEGGVETSLVTSLPVLSILVQTADRQTDSVLRELQ